MVTTYIFNNGMILLQADEIELVILYDYKTVSIDCKNTISNLAEKIIEAVHFLQFYTRINIHM